MKRRSFVVCALLAATIFGAGVAAGAGPTPYDPTQIYSGPFGPSTVYYRESFRATWRLGVTGGVTCPDALSHFKVSGLWKGHLKSDGSCGALDEPSEWAVGNRLNYDALTRGGH